MPHGVDELQRRDLLRVQHALVRVHRHAFGPVLLDQRERLVGRKLGEAPLPERLDRLSHPLELAHEFLIDGGAARRVDDQHIVEEILRAVEGLLCGPDGVAPRLAREDRHPGAGFREERRRGHV